MLFQEKFRQKQRNGQYLNVPRKLNNDFRKNLKKYTSMRNAGNEHQVI